MDLRVRERALGLTEEEIRSEMAASLGRIGRTLQELLLKLEKLRAEIAVLKGTERSHRVEQFNDLRQEAKLYYWYLIVQRESIGLRSHSDVAKLYSIPSRED